MKFKFSFITLILTLITTGCVSLHEPKFERNEILSISKASALEHLNRISEQSVKEKNDFRPICVFGQNGYYGKDAEIFKNGDEIEAYLIPYNEGFYYQAFEISGLHHIALYSRETDLKAKGSCSLGPINWKEATIESLAMLERLGGINITKK